MENVSPKIEPVVFNAGEVLFYENERSFHFYIIQEGLVEIYKSAPSGERVILATVGEGLSIGEFAMIDRNPRSATAQAATEVKAMKVSEAAYKELIDDLPDWAVSVMRALVDRVRRTNEIVRNLTMAPEVQTAIDRVEYDDSKTNTNLLMSSDDDMGDTPDLA